MIIKLSFSHPELIPSSKDATEYIFPYKFVDKKILGEPEEVSETKSYQITASITGTLHSMWKLSDDNLLKVLYEYVKRYLKEKIIDGSITDNDEYSLSTDSHPKDNPFDYTRIHYLESIEIETKWNIEADSGQESEDSETKQTQKKLDYDKKKVADKINEINQYMKDKNFDLAKTKLLELEEQVHSEQYNKIAAGLYRFRIEDKLAKKAYSDARSIAREYIDFSYKVDEEKYRMDGLYYETVSLYGMGEKDISVTKMKQLISEANSKADKDLLGKIRNWAEAIDEKEKTKVLKFLNSVNRIQKEYVDKLRKNKDTAVKDDIRTDPNRKLALDSDILNDTSVKGELDLGYQVYVNAFVALIDNYGKDMAPLTIGIHGEWGSGKTTLMGAIKKKLDGKKYISILFNAWKYNEEEGISRAFLRHSLLQVGNNFWWLRRFWYKLRLLRLNYFFLKIILHLAKS